MECSRTPPKANSQNTRLDNISRRCPRHGTLSPAGELKRPGDATPGLFLLDVRLRIESAARKLIAFATLVTTRYT